MNKKLRGRAESLLILQECGAMTDRQTLNSAIIIAHHDKRFQVNATDWNLHFEKLARLMREKYPTCPCKACALK